MEKIPCIICENRDFSHFLDVSCRYSGKIFSLKKCKCSLILTTPRPTEEEIPFYYEGHDYDPHRSAESNGSFLQAILKKISYTWKSKLIRKYIKNRAGRVVDIGGGDGSLAIYLKKKNLSIDVYEKSSFCVDFIKKQDIFASSNLLDFKNDVYDVIMLWHSLEHVHDMSELFSNINRIAKDDSRIILAVPNSFASEIFFFKEKWIAWDAPRHLYHFNYKTLNLLLNKHGWKIIKRKRILQDTLFNIYSSVNSIFIVNFFLFLFVFPISFLTQIFFKNKVSSNLIICKRK